MANRYWVGNGGNVNSTAHWSATDGGVGGASVPGGADDVFFTVNSFTLTGQIVTCTGATTIFSFKSLNLTGMLNSPTFTIARYRTYGNLTLIPGMTLSTGITTGVLEIYGACTLICAGNRWEKITTFKNGTYNFNLGDKCYINRSSSSSTGLLLVHGGNFNTNNYDFDGCTIKVSTLVASNITLNLGSSLIEIYGYGWDLRNNDINNITINAGTSTIDLLSTTTSNFFVNGGTYNKVRKLNGARISITVTPTKTCIINDLRVQGTSTMSCSISGLLTVNNIFQLNGTINYPLITDFPTGISVPSGTICEYILASSCVNSNGGNLFFNKSVNNGNNNNITFTNDIAIGGNGNISTPFLIASAYQLNFVRYLGISEIYFKQTADIDVSIDYPNWIPIGYPMTDSVEFKGFYNGDFFQIKKLTKALFNSISLKYISYVFKNIKLIDVNIIGTGNNTGALLNFINIPTTSGFGSVVYLMDNIVVTGTINSIYDYTGAICGYYGAVVDSTIWFKRISANVDINGNSYIGGIIGGTRNGGTYDICKIKFEDCINNGNMIGNNYVGGMCGYFGYTLNMSVLTINKCINTGIIKGINYVSGVFGYPRGTGTYCYGLQIRVERISGANNTFNRIGGGTISNCWALDTMIYRRNGEYDTTVFPVGNNGTDITVENSKKQATFTGFTFDANYWGINEDTSYPYLQIWPTVTPSGIGFKIYLGAVQVTKIYKGTVEITEAYLGTKTLQ